MFKSRKADGAMGLLVVLIIVFFVGWLITVSQRECRSNKDCGSESYCGSDFSCHQYPTIYKTEYNFAVPAIIIGIAIIIAVLIYRWDKIMPRRNDESKEAIVEEYKSEIEEAPEVESIDEPYYKNEENKNP